MLKFGHLVHNKELLSILLFIYFCSMRVKLCSRFRMDYECRNFRLRKVIAIFVSGGPAKIQGSNHSLVKKILVIFEF